MYFTKYLLSGGKDKKGEQKEENKGRARKLFWLLIVLFGLIYALSFTVIMLSATGE